MKIQAVLYDMDGTLLDTEKLHKMAWTQCAAQRGVVIGPEFYQGAMGRNLQRVFALLRELYPNIGDTQTLYEEKEAVCRAWMDEHGVPVLPGAHEALGALGARGVRQCVCTSTSRDSAERTLAAAGGQHVNRTDSAVRITHIPTGIVVQCQNERSQIQNREQAMAVLRARLVELRERENQEKMSEIKGELKKIEWGSQIRSYVFQPYTMVKDHRTGFEVGDIDSVMDGDLDGFITAYLQML